ncbi:hypothetical protein DV737_g2860, partial [Chaetothyriales sp. CBS 132003]
MATVREGAWNDPSDPLSDPEEQQVLLSTLDSFRQYRRQSHYNTTHRRRQNLYALPPQHFKLLTAQPFSLLDHLSAIDDAIDSNADIADAIFSRGLASNVFPPWYNTASPDQHSKAHSTIRQFYRDWTAPGFQAEVKPILDLVLRSLHKHNIAAHPSTHILVPGAGLGRLLFELTLVGYSATGNEISYHQLLASDFILNSGAATGANGGYTIYPFANTFTNNLTAAHQLRSYTVPDVHPGTALALAHAQGRVVGQMGMAAGDFTTSFASGTEYKQAFDAVATVYFIDTAPNVLRYIETIHHCLKPGGVWVNVGPLLWHFDGTGGPASSSSSPSANKMGKEEGNNNNNADEVGKEGRGNNNNADEDKGIAQPGAFELADDQVRELVRKMGFVIHQDGDGDDGEELQLQQLLNNSGAGGYMQDPESMLQNRYRPSFWVATKLE